MATTPRPRAIALAITTIVALAAPTACSAGDESSPDGPSPTNPSIASMLELTPDTEANRAWIAISLPWRAEAFDPFDPDAPPVDRGTGAPGDPPTSRSEDARLLEHQFHTSTLISLPSHELRSFKVRTEELPFGLDPREVTGTLTAAEPPHSLNLITGTFDGEAVLDAAARADEAEQASIGGLDGVRWGDDGSRFGGTAPAIGVGPRPFRLVRFGASIGEAQTDDGIEAFAETIEDDGPVMADDDAFGAVAAELDDHEAYAAVLTSGPSEADSGDDADRATTTTRPGPDQPVLPRTGIRAVGIGATVRDGDPVFVLVVAADDEAAATATIESARELLEKGTNPTSGLPWAEELSDVEVAVDGDLATLTATLTRPNLWLRMAGRGEGLGALLR